MGIATEIRRVALAVRNLEKAGRLFGAVLGAELTKPEVPVGEEVRCLEWRRGPGAPILELVQPVDDDGAVARFIRKRGEGIHHLSFSVPDLPAAVAEVRAAGGRVVRTPSYYRRADGGALREAFVHPKDAHGTLIHLVEAE